MKILLIISSVLLIYSVAVTVALIERGNRLYWEGVVSERAFYVTALAACAEKNGTATFTVQQQEKEIRRLRVASYETQTAPDLQFHRQLQQLLQQSKRQPDGTVCLRLKEDGSR